MPGRIQRALAKIFDHERDNAFTAEDLCERIWPHLTWFEQSQRSNARFERCATSLRSDRKSSGSIPRGAATRSCSSGTTQVMSYAMAQLKADRFQRYHITRPSWSSEADLRRELDKESYREAHRPGGAWRRQVEILSRPTTFWSLIERRVEPRLKTPQICCGFATRPTNAPPGKNVGWTCPKRIRYNGTSGIGGGRASGGYWRRVSTGDSR